MNNNYIFKLVTGHNISYNCNSTLTGSIFEYPYIKNELDINAPLSKFKVDDYIYLEKTNNIVANPFKTIDLTNYSTYFDSNYVYYPSANISNELINSNINISTFLNYLNNKEITDNKNINNFLKKLNMDQEDSETIKEKVALRYLSKSSKIIKVDKNLINFIIVSLLRGKKTSFLETIDNKNLVISNIAYKFNHNNSYHKDMKNNLIKFLDMYNISYHLVIYDKYDYINLTCTPLIKFFSEILKSNFEYLQNFSNSLQIYFLKNLMYNSKNNYYTDAFKKFGLIKLGLNNNLLFYQSKNNKYETPYTVSLSTEEEEYKKELPDIQYLENGFLIRILDITPIN